MDKAITAGVGIFTLLASGFSQTDLWPQLDGNRQVALVTWEHLMTSIYFGTGVYAICRWEKPVWLMMGTLATVKILFLRRNFKQAGVADSVLSGALLFFIYKLNQ